MDLYGIPYSPDCGRAQFALEVKQLDYKFSSFTPRVSERGLIRVAGRVELPTLLDKQIILRGGDEIIDYLETEYPDVRIRGTDEADMSAIQRYVTLYHELCRGFQADVMIRFRRNVNDFGKESPFGFFPKFGRVPAANWILERLDEIWACNTTNFQQNREHITSSLRSLVAQLRPGQPLVGATITDADICFCELGCLFRPEEDSRNNFGRSLLGLLQAEWVTPDITHPYEVWRDSMRRLADSSASS